VEIPNFGGILSEFAPAKRYTSPAWEKFRFILGQINPCKLRRILFKQFYRRMAADPPVQARADLAFKIPQYAGSTC